MASPDAGCSPTNLARLTDGLARGLYLPVKLDDTQQVGFVVRIDDAPFGPVAVVHLPEGRFVRVVYRAPEELTLITPDDSVRIH